MSDLKKYVGKRKKRDAVFASQYDEGYRDFKIGAMLKMAREEAGLTQEELAKMIHTKKTAISRLEHHAKDIRLSTLEKVANALGLKFRIELV